MNKISTLFSKHVRNLHFLLLLVVSLVYLFTGDFIIEKTNEVFISIFHSPFKYIDQNLSNLKEVRQLNDDLNKKVAELSEQVTFLDEARKENERLRSILGFEKPPGYNLIPAEVISVSGDFIPVSVVINKGSDDSVVVDQTVINQLGLIGRITMVSSDYSVVQLLTDPSNRVASRVVTSREMGIVKYSTKKGMILDNFPIQGTIAVGDTIISSGLGGVYPAGLLVGEVTSVVRKELQPFCDITIKAAANFYSLDELFILKEEAE